MKLTLAVQCLLLSYHQFTTLVDVYPFNGVRFTKPKERYVEAVVNFVLMGLPILGFAFGYEPLMRYGVAYYFILFAVECATWWLPYFVGASPKWLEIYRRVHSTTLGVLPGRDARTAPNLEHLILMVITVASASVTLRQYLLAHPAGYPHVWISVAVGAALACGTGLQQVRKRNDE